MAENVVRNIGSTNYKVWEPAGVLRNKITYIVQNKIPSIPPPLLVIWRLGVGVVQGLRL